MQMPSSISTRLQYQHKSLLDIIDGLSDEQIRMQMNPGKWSIFENIVHLQTYQHIFIKPDQEILDEEIPVFTDILQRLIHCFMIIAENQAVK